VEGAGVLTITKLRGAEYLIAAVAEGLEDYYMGAGEAPGVWQGRWAAELGLEGVVEADALRALVDGLEPATRDDLMAKHRERTVRVIDVTLSVPKSVSLLWAFGTSETSSVVSIAIADATATALAFLEERAAVARVQQDGLRRRVATDGFAIATFTHRTSRAGDPQLHTHCLIPNVVRRDDGVHVAFDANPLHVWGKATGTVFLNELERLLTERLGVEWGPERNGSRELVGFSRDQLRTFSKRTVAIETHLEASGETVFDSPAERMRADDRASLQTRQRKDKSLTPERLRDRWSTEATAVGLEPGAGVDDLAVGRQVASRTSPGQDEVFAALVDPTTGLCATNSRFGEAHVVERVAAMAGGRLTVGEVVALSRWFLASDLVVRLAPDVKRRRPAEWSTVEHRTVEDRLLARLHALAAGETDPVERRTVLAAIAAEGKRLGPDQAMAVRILCGDGPAVRALVAPAGHGKTTTLHAAVTAARQSGRDVIVVAPTHKAVGELRAAGLEAETIARTRTWVTDGPVEPGTILVIDEISQVGTRDAAALLEALAATPGAQLWCAGDVRQAQSVAAGGLAVELERLAANGEIPSVGLTGNRRQQHPAEQQALALFRAGDVDASQTIRAVHGWEHEHASPGDTRQALAAAAVTDADQHGPEHVAVLAVSHADCEDLADRMRALRAARGELRGPTLAGPGWGNETRTYAAGDRILLHTNDLRDRQVANGSTGTVLTVDRHRLTVLIDDGPTIDLPAALVAGYRPDGTPNVSHAWARTVDGAQGGTWRQVHLLGTPTLDRFTGYVGQSRGQLPTHTWNTRPEHDHPASLIADQRDPAEAVVDAMRRAEPKTLAAVDDPWTLDRQLRTERDQHTAVIADRPPNRQADLDAARRAATRAAEDLDRAVQGVAFRKAERDRLGPLAKLRRGGRDDITRADQNVDGAHRHLGSAHQDLEIATAQVADLEAAVAARRVWDRTDGWRVGRVAEIDDTLAHHWADVTLRAVRADDPLAFGIDPLRHARATYQADLEQILATLPPDRRTNLADAQNDLAHRIQHLRTSDAAVGRARAALDAVSKRHWGRHDKPAIHAAERHLGRTDHDRQRAADAIAPSRDRVARERHAVHRWTDAVQATAEPRVRLSNAIDDLDDALSRTRPGRVAAAAADHTSVLWAVLGVPPTTRGGLAAWCGIAEQVTAYADLHAFSDDGGHAPRGRDEIDWIARLDRLAGPRWDRPASLVEHADRIITTAARLDTSPAPEPLRDRARWRPCVEHAIQDLAIERCHRGIEHDLGLGR
jgi:conjugative relaxase-like TrwC/TraI family protein